MMVRNQFCDKEGLKLSKKFKEVFVGFTTIILSIWGLVSLQGEDRTIPIIFLIFGLSWAFVTIVEKDNNNKDTH